MIDGGVSGSSACGALDVVLGAPAGRAAAGGVGFTPLDFPVGRPAPAGFPSMLSGAGTPALLPRRLAAPDSAWTLTDRATALPVPPARIELPAGMGPAGLPAGAAGAAAATEPTSTPASVPTSTAVDNLPSLTSFLPLAMVAAGRPGSSYSELPQEFYRLHF